MGPLVPEVISNEFNLMIAFIVGIGFGYVLEQAGFSSTRKLVGLFYGYDFTVLRVFFTAGVTALVGVLLLNHFNLLNLEMIYINPTFLWSAIIGGGIMGAGFIVGGFCPGTSMCAAASGRIDAMFFIVGSFIGILGFTEFYPYFKDLYVAENLGAVRIDQFFGISSEMFAVILTLVAITAFVGVRFVEEKVNGRPVGFDKTKFNKRFAVAALPIAIILFTASLPSVKEIHHSEIEEKIADNSFVFSAISTDKLLSELSNNHNGYNLIDVRSKEDYDKSHIPLAINIPFEELHQYYWQDFFKQKFKVNIFYSDNLEEAKRAYLVAEKSGAAERLLYNESLESYLNSTVLADQLASTSMQDKWRIDTHNKLVEKERFLSKFSAPVKKKEIKIQGGCS